MAKENTILKDFPVPISLIMMPLLWLQALQGRKTPAWLANYTRIPTVREISVLF